MFKLNSHGMTLLEVLLATVLLSIGFFAMISVFWSSQKAGESSRSLTSAAALSHDIFERCNSLPFSAIPATTAFVPYTATNPAANGFTREWRVETNGLDPDMKTISVRITWNEKGSAKSQKFSMVKRNDF